MTSFLITQASVQDHDTDCPCLAFGIIFYSIMFDINRDKKTTDRAVDSMGGSTYDISIPRLS